MEYQLKDWVVRDYADPATIKRLSEKWDVPGPVAALMASRGLTDDEAAEHFFRPRVDQLHDPMLMADMDKACSRVCSAILNEERILVYGDYDVDGTTAVAMMYKFLGRLTDTVGYYIPDRYTEGYGVSARGIDFAHEHNYSLIITLDCGIKANAMVNRARTHKIDVVICDHHNPGDFLPAAYAVLDPKRHDCPYPFKELSGCGVGFKLIHAVCVNLGLSLKEYLFCYIDLVAVSIASDIVPIIGENRVLAHFGIKKIEIAPMPGIKALLDVAGLTEVALAHKITVTDLVFKIGPRINAAGRIESGLRAVDLLIADSVAFANNIATEINNFNEDRKDLDRSITEEALQMIANDNTSHSRKSTIVYSPDWHKGVIGIVASRIIEHYYRPTIVLTYSEGKITGSARSVDGFDLYSALEKCEHLLTNWGGHKYAAGLSMKPEHLQAFTDAFELSVAQSITTDQLTPKIYIDTVIRLSDISSDLLNKLRLFEPFGPGNMTPVFVSYGLHDSGSTRAVGADSTHLKLSATDHEITTPIDGIGFGLGHFAQALKESPFSVCYSVAENIFRDKVSIQIIVKDLKID